ncbi:hypothetical protein [Kineosporia sp. A_224]|uniref:hypothetical protein n=1 Tax=Kineosporia sp. A_224 TaxID=1962180 RepID=UPI00117B0DF6|nr:hypothetical protein [Kineosporia sp. A_224]
MESESWEHVPVDVLSEVPDEARSRELWMQHAIGYVLMAQMREYAVARIPQDASIEARQLAMRVLDHALFGLMEICDGFNGPLRSPTHEFSVDLVGTLRRSDDETVVARQTLFDGDGACMGVHGWLDGDFGEAPPAQQVQAFTAQSDWLAH